MEGQTPQSVLKSYWGHSAFRTFQLEIIESVLSGHDTLAVLPTGGGKSVCFQVPALLRDGVCIVITPLIALMEDQVHQLKQKNIAAVAVHSGKSHREIDMQLDNCIYGQIKFLYVSPERIQTELFQERVKKMKVNLVAVDEAHCISQWGHDFRPPYLQIKILRQLQPLSPIIALTASATRLVRNDIIVHLEMNQPAQFQKSFARDNLSFVVRLAENKEKKLLQILRKVPGTAIIYVRSRKATQQVAEFLERQNISASFYHAGLSYSERSKRQADWSKSHTRVMVATNAFGMGIDKPDVRVVIHLDLPENLESYYQEAGRAGRDGKRSYAAILFHELDGSLLREKVHQVHPPLEVLRNVYQALANYYQLALGSAHHTTFGFDLEDFCKRFSLHPSSTHAALMRLQGAGLLELSESFFRPSRLFFAVDNKKLYEFQVANALYDSLIKSLLRLYGAELFSEFITIQESQIAKANKLTIAEVKARLTQLEKMHLLIYEPITDQPQLTFLTPRLDAEHLPIDKKKLQERRDLNLSKMEAMISYVKQNDRCRMQVIQSYFDEETSQSCGLCDVCIDRRKRESLATFQDYQQQILYLLRQKPLTADELEQAVDPKDAAVFIEVVREMVDDGIIAYDELWFLHLTHREV
jgi:ATP-dependent DNA helicase RecQ